MYNAEERINQALMEYPSVGHIMAVEPVISDLMWVAATQDEPSLRWDYYEILKIASLGFVGWEARVPELRTRDNYLLMVSVYDLLLPSPEIDNRTLEDSEHERKLQRLRDRVAGIIEGRQPPPLLDGSSAFF